MSCNVGAGGHRCLASLASDLEAFTRNPTAGSFTVSAFQLAVFAKDLNEYYLQLYPSYLNTKKNIRQTLAEPIIIHLDPSYLKFSLRIAPPTSQLPIHPHKVKSRRYDSPHPTRNYHFNNRNHNTHTQCRKKMARRNARSD